MGGLPATAQVFQGVLGEKPSMPSAWWWCCWPSSFASGAEEPNDGPTEKTRGS